MNQQQINPCYSLSNLQIIYPKFYRFFVIEYAPDKYILFNTGIEMIPEINSKTKEVFKLKKIILFH